MKSIPRSGWISHGVSLLDVESVADHSFSTCALALLLVDLEIKRGKQLNVERVLRLAVLHDMAESLTFDMSKDYLQYMGRRGQKIKREVEQSAWKHIARSLDQTLRRRYTNLQREFEAGKTFESKLVHAADRLDILMQIVEYRRRGYPKPLLVQLWNTTMSKLRSSGVPSARKIQRMLIRENTKLKGNVK